MPAGAVTNAAMRTRVCRTVKAQPEQRQRGAQQAALLARRRRQCGAAAAGVVQTVVVARVLQAVQQGTKAG